MMFSKRSILLGLVVLVVGGVSVAALAGSDHGTTLRMPDADEPAIATVEPAAADSFGFMRRAQTAADRLPASVADGSQLPYGANVALSRRVAWGNGTEVFAVPARGVICTVVPDREGTSSTGCQPTDWIVRGNGTGPALIHLAEIDKVYAVVPDGVESVTLTRKSGKTLGVAIQNGGYYVEVPTSDPPRTVAYDGPNGHVTQQVPIPPDLPFGK